MVQKVARQDLAAEIAFSDTLGVVYEKKVGRAYGRGCLRSSAIAVVGALFGVVMIVTVLVVIRGGDIEPRSGRLALALLVPFVFMGALMAVATLVVAWRGRRLDRAFTPWRLQGRQTGGVLREWHGTVEGREFDAWFHKGPTLELYLACAPRMRGVVHRGGRLIQAVSRALEPRRPMEPSPLDLEGAVFLADDEDWLRALLARPRAEAALRELMTETHRVGAAVFFAPNAVRYMRRFMPLSEMTSQNLRSWTSQLGVLAEAVDRLGPASTDAEPTPMEEWARLRRGRFLKTFFLILGAVMLLSWGALFLFGWLNVGTP